MGLYKRKSDGNWWGRYARADGRIIRRSLGTRNQRVATKRLYAFQNQEWEEQKGIIKDPPPKLIDFGEFAELFLEQHARRKASFSDDKQRANTYLVPFFKGLKVHQIDDRRVSLLMRHLADLQRGPKEKPLSEATRNRILALLRTLLRKAKQWGYAVRVPEFRLFREEHRTRYLSADEQAQILVAAEKRPELHAFILLMLNSALRPGEGRRLKWEHVEGGSILVRGKGNRLRRVPLNRAALSALDSLERRSAYVFPLLRNNLRRYFTAAVEDAGLETSGERKVTPHVLRHSALSTLAHKGADIASLKNLAGHSTITTTQRYMHSRDLKATVELLDV